MNLSFLIKKNICHAYARSLTPFFELSRRMGGYKEVCWLVGDGRSGTTWLAESLNANREYRYMFEPVHPFSVPELTLEKSWIYVRAEERNQFWDRLGERIFTGGFHHPRVDAYCPFRFRYDRLLVKDIFGHLLMTRFLRIFPFLKVVLLVRNPFAVALSKVNKAHQQWIQEPVGFLEQPELVEDYLASFTDLIRETEGEFEKQILNWSVIHYVLFKELNGLGDWRSRLRIVFYEDFCLDPITQLQSLFLFMRPGEEVDLKNVSEKMVNPSKMGDDKRGDWASDSWIDAWRGKIDEKTRLASMRILDKFGLSDLYGDDSKPNHERIKIFQIG